MKIHNPTAVHAAPTYSHGIEVPPSARWLYISGQVGAGRDGTPREGIEAQTNQAFENLKAILASAGMSFTDVVKVTSYLIHEDLIDGFRKARTVQMGDHRPAATLVIARRLAQPGWLVEIEAIAAKA
ncbi:MAG TPA: RidA family protein [Stellaceae bacterium]|nr:RidA family protein [Stellaceae bacterium]